MHFSYRKFLTFTFVIFAFAAFHVASADTTFSGTITGDVTWTKANSPYITGYVDIPAGASLTLQPGTIVKVIENGTPFSVEGTLTSGSTGGEPVVVTSIKDDSVGGDSNLDGTTTNPASGDWREITIQRGGVVSMVNTTIRYGGLHTNTGYSGDSYVLPLIHNAGGILTLDNCILTDSGYFGILQDSGTSSVKNSFISRISTTGILSEGGHIDASGNTFDTMGRGIEVTAGDIVFSGNSFANITIYAVALDGSSVTFNDQGGNTSSSPLFISLSLVGDEVFPKDGLVYVVGYLAIPQGMTLSISPGAIVKVLSTSPIFVDGTLAIGSSVSSDKVYLTSYADDSVGGDTNGDGSAKMPARGDWRSMIFSANSHGVFQNAVVHYGGASVYNAYSGGYDYFPSIRNNGGTFTFDHVALLDSGNYGIQQISGMATITDSELARDGYGLVVVGGTASINHSSIHDNATYGVYNVTANVVDATQNWWGAYGGPTHPSNPFGTGDKVTDNVDYGQWLTDVPSTGCTVNCNSNVLFLPGLEASRLYEKDSLGYEHRRWEPEENLDVKDLFLDDTGKYPASPANTNAKIYTRDVVDEGYPDKFGIAAPNIYKSFMSMMDDLKNNQHKIDDWEAVPYDWRLSIDDILNNGKKDGVNISYTDSTSTPYVIQELKRLAARSRTGKVTIIAHSNGGLVAKALMQRLGDSTSASLIDKVILVASPQLGTPEALGALLQGHNQGIPTIPLYLSPGTARALSKNLPGAYNLLPSAQYLSGLNSSSGAPMISFDTSASQLQLLINAYGDKITTPTALNAFLIGNEGRPAPAFDNVTYPTTLNSGLLTQAGSLHSLIDSWTPPAGIQVYQIAGWGNDTLSGIHYKQGSFFHCLGLNPCMDYDPILVEDGDGTVVTPSALAMSTSSANVQRLWVNMQGYNNDHQIITSFGLLGVTHKNILEVPNLLDFIGGALSSTTKPLSSYTYLSTSTPPSTSDHKLRYFLHSPLSLDLYDDQGHHTGVSTSTGLIDDQIPGSYYRTFGEVKYITAPASTPLHLVMNGQASGYFTLNVQEVTGDNVTATTSFVDIPTSTSTKANMDFTDGTITHASPLRIDEDGNGATDFSLLPKLNDIVTLPLPKLPLTLTANNKTLILGSSVPVLTGVLLGFQSGDTASTSVTGTAFCTTTATSTSPVGTYSITCAKGTLVSDKYDVTSFIPGTLTIFYRWSGYLQPINDTVANPNQTLSVFKGGSTVPVKFQLMKASGTLVQASSSPLFLTPQKGSAMSAAVDESTYSDPASSGTAFKYDSTSQQYIYNWSTKGLTAGYWYKLSAKLDDGTVQSVVVGLR